MDIHNYLKDPKVFAYYGMIIENQICKLQKGFKTAKEMLRFTYLRLFDKGEIHKDTKLINI